MPVLTGEFSNSLACEHQHKASLEGNSAAARRTVEERAITDVGRTHLLEQLHRGFGRERDPIIDKVLHLRSRQRRLLRVTTLRSSEATAGKQLVHKGDVLIQLKVGGAVNLAIVKDILNGHLSLVISEEVVELDRSLKPDEGVSEVVDNRATSRVCSEESASRETFREPRPRTTRRVNLVRFKVALVFKMVRILIDEVPNFARNHTLRPLEPILNRRLNVEHSPAVKFGRVELTNLIVATVFAAVNRRKDKRFGVENVTVNLTRVSQLKEALSNLRRRTVNLIDEENDRRGTRKREPIGRVPSGDTLTTNLRIARVGQTKKVTLRHLRSTTLHNRQAKGAGGLVDDLRLADAVATTNEDRLANLGDVGRESGEGGEVDRHGVVP